MGTMHYVGLDVHTRRSSLCVLDGDGKPVRQFEVRAAWPQMLDRVAAEVPRPFAVCFEASCGYGYLHAKLSGMAEHVAVAHPGQLRLIFRSKRKNDRVDAAKVAKLLCLDAVPQVHVPGAGVRAWRGLFAHRQTLVGRRVAVKNQVRALLRSHAIAMPAGKRLWSGKGLAWLKAQELAAAADDALRRDLMAEELAGLTTRLARVDKELAARPVRRAPGGGGADDDPRRRGADGRGAGGAPGRRAAVPPQQAGRRLPGARPVPGRVGRAGAAGAHRRRRAGGRAEAAVRGRVAGRAAEPDAAGVPRAAAARGPGPQEGRPGRDRPAPGVRGRGDAADGRGMARDGPAAGRRRRSWRRPALPSGRHRSRKLSGSSVGVGRARAADVTDRASEDDQASEAG